MDLLDRLTRTLADASRLTAALMEDPARRMPPERPPEPAQPSLPGPEGAKPKKPEVLPGVAERARVRAAAEQTYAQASGGKQPEVSPAEARRPGVRPAGSKNAPGVRPAGSKRAPAAQDDPPAAKKAPAKKAPAKKRPPAAKKPAAAALPAGLHRETLDALHHAVMVVSTDRRVLYTNGAMCRYIGLVTGRDWTPEQLDGMDLAALPSLAALRLDEDPTPRVAAEGPLVLTTWQSRLLGADGAPIGTLLEAAPAGFDPGD